jgi:hypothetical protein
MVKLRHSISVVRLMSSVVSVLVMLPSCSVRAQARGLTSADLPPQLNTATRQAIERLADSLRSARLPSDPIYAKAAEGVLKRAEDARILAAVQRLARALGDARRALGDDAEEAELVAGASALQSGVPPAMLRRLREAQRPLPRGSLATPLIVLADLVTRRVPPGVAAAAIDSLVARNAPSEDFAALRAGVERDIDAGRAPDAATLLRARSLLEALSAADRGTNRRVPRSGPAPD